MLFHGLLLALAFYAGIVVGMTHVHASGAAGHAAAAAAAADCPPCSADTASKSGISDAQIESIVDKRVEVGKSYMVCVGLAYGMRLLCISAKHMLYMYYQDYVCHNCAMLTQVPSYLITCFTSELARRAKQRENHQNNGDSAMTALAKNANKLGDSTSRTSNGVSDFAHGFARIDHDEFIQTYDYGVASQHFDSKGSSEALILYTKKAVPSDAKTAAAVTGNDGEMAPLLDAKTATENCDVMNVVTLAARNADTCTVVLSDYESFHMQRWMRQPYPLRMSRSHTLQRSLPLRHVGRGVGNNGKDSFPAPRIKHQVSNMKALKTYFEALDDVKRELSPIAKRVAKNNAIVVLVCNKGQSDLLMNFACSSKAKGLDISNFLVFATDQHTYDVAKGMGFEAFFDKANFGDLPEAEAGHYGDKIFAHMMFAKVVPVQMLNMMGYDVLFQDVDVIWNKNPLSVFHDKSSKLYDFDILFQDDGARAVRFAPYSGNTGFYYVRHNKETQYLFTQLLYNGDLIQETNSHQQALTALLTEHASMTGLKVKTLEGDDFPSGFHYHRKKPLMKKIAEGKHEPYLFHMCWTANKDNKILFMKQMGMWYMKEECTGTEALTKLYSDQTPVSSCCLAEPSVSCHYRDKPSIIPCKDSPPIDQGRPSFW